MQKPLSSEFLADLHRRYDQAFTVTETLALPLQQGACPEEFGDNIRLWCRKNCVGRWKQLERCARKAILMAFESAADAAMFRDRAYSACQALSADRRRRYSGSPSS